MAQISSASQSSFLQLGIFSSSQGCTKHVLCGATTPWPYLCQHPSCARCHPESLFFTPLWVFTLIYNTGDFLFVHTYFISSGSSLSSLVGVILIPLFLARGQPDRLCLKREERAVWLARPPPHQLPPNFARGFDLSRFAASHHEEKSGEKNMCIWGDGQ